MEEGRRKGGIEKEDGGGMSESWDSLDVMSWWLVLAKYIEI